MRSDTVEIRKADPVPQPATVTAASTTDYEVGQNNVKVMGLDLQNPVFFVSAVVIVAFVDFTLMFRESADGFFNWLRPAITNAFDWPLLLAGNLFVLFALMLVVTPLGSVRLGGPDAVPDYGYPGWFAMLFAAGMGIGLMFFGVSEPLSHYASSFGGTAVENGARTDWAPLGAAVGDAQAAREFVICVILIPSAVSIVWMSTFGGAALDQVITLGNTAVGEAAQELKLFEMLKEYPITPIASSASPW